MVSRDRRGRKPQDERLRLRALGADLRFSDPVFRYAPDRVCDVRLEGIGPTTDFVSWAIVQEELHEPSTAWSPITEGRLVEPQCLADLLDLEDGDDRDIQVFVTRYGPLGLWPISWLDKEKKIRYGEKLSLYRAVARRCSLILTTVYRIEHSQDVPNKDWRELLPDWLYKIAKPHLETYRDSNVSPAAPNSRQVYMSYLLEQTLDPWINLVPLYLSLGFEYRHGVFSLHLSNESGYYQPYKYTPRATSIYEALMAVVSPDKATSYQKHIAEHLPKRWEGQILSDPDAYRDLFLPVHPDKAFQAVVVRLVAAITSQNGIYICASCLKPFEANVDGRRRPAKGKAALCGKPECVRKQAALISRKHREDEKVKKALKAREEQ